MSTAPELHGIFHRILYAVALASAIGCGEPAPAELPSMGAAPAPTTLAPPPALPAPPPTPPPVAPEPPPDPEALALAREEAAREAFEREYPWHGIAYHFLGQIHQRPDAASPVIGYMRRGAQFRAQATVRGSGCPRGWSRIPGDGYVCRGTGFALGDTPQTFEPSPVGPAHESALPYAYAWVTRDDVPQYWRLPTREEEALVARWIAQQRAAQQRLEAPAPAPAAPATSTEVASPDEEAETSAAAEPDLEAPPGLGRPPSEETAEVAADAGVPGAAPTDTMPAVLRLRMLRGFYVSIDRLEVDGDRRFYRTVRGTYVPADAVGEATPPAMRGVVLGGRWSLPLGFVYRGGVRSLRRDSARGTLQMAAPIDRLTPLPLEEERVQRGSQRYRVSNRGEIVREDALRVASPLERPASIPADARWIHVDRGEQTLVAYEGDRPIFATLVSTGREGYETPVGTFRIQSKHVSTTMDDPEAGAEAYSIEDVPWTMYFHESYALHGAFWHDRFGRVRSHGCVNLAPADARWLFQWTDPHLAAGWHGASAGRGARGTFVHVTD